MYKQEEILQMFKDDNDADEKYYLVALLMTELLLNKKIEESSEKEYFEALIFSSFMVIQLFKFADDSKRNDAIKAMFTKLAFYAIENPELTHLSEGNIIKFFHNRYMAIASEVSRLNQSQTYLIPLLIYNLYINPINDDGLNAEEAIKLIDRKNLIKESIIFRKKYTHFMEVFKKTLQYIS